MACGTHFSPLSSLFVHIFIHTIILFPFYSFIHSSPIIVLSPHYSFVLSFFPNNNLLLSLLLLLLLLLSVRKKKRDRKTMPNKISSFSLLINKSLSSSLEEEEEEEDEEEGVCVSSKPALHPPHLSLGGPTNHTASPSPQTVFLTAFFSSHPKHTTNGISWGFLGGGAQRQAGLAMLVALRVLAHAAVVLRTHPSALCKHRPEAGTLLTSEGKEQNATETG
jgi:hypothetical protein